MLRPQSVHVLGADTYYILYFPHFIITSATLDNVNHSQSAIGFYNLLIQICFAPLHLQSFDVRIVFIVS